VHLGEVVMHDNRGQTADERIRVVPRSAYCCARFTVFFTSGTEPPDDQAAQVEMAPRLDTARASIEDREPAPSRQRPPEDRDAEDANARDGELYGSPLLDGLHAKAVGQRAVKRRGPEDKVRPTAGISKSPGRREGELGLTPAAIAALKAAGTVRATAPASTVAR